MTKKIIPAASVREQAIDVPGRSLTCKTITGDARHLPLADRSIDLVVTSPPYWRKRDYGVAAQIGQELAAGDYVKSIVDALREWRRVLRPTGSVFLNIGDSYFRRSLAGIPSRIEAAALEEGWVLRNRIVWAKSRGVPDPARNRLTPRHEYILHLTPRHNYYYDLFGYSERFGNGTNPGDVWHIELRRNLNDHLAPYPEEIVERAVTLACPLQVCSRCGAPRCRIVRRTVHLDANRPQARRAMEIAAGAGLTDAHLRAIQATGISDAGKAMRTQNGTGRNSARTRKLANEAKLALGGYFREFTFAQRETAGWTTCSCRRAHVPGVVLDPFMGTGTSILTALRMGRSAVGVDLVPDAQFDHRVETLREELLATVAKGG